MSDRGKGQLMGRGPALVARELAFLRPSKPDVEQLGGKPEDLRNTLCGVYEHFGMDGLEKVTAYALKNRGINAFDGKLLDPTPAPNIHNQGEAS